MRVSESWLKDSGYSFDIEGYEFIHNPRLNRIGGGVGIYVDNDLEFKLRPDLAITDISSPSTECSLKSAGLIKKNNCWCHLQTARL